MSTDNWIRYAALGDEMSREMQAPQAHVVVAGVLLDGNQTRVIGGVTHQGKLFRIDPPISLPNKIGYDPQTKLPNRINNVMPTIVFAQESEQIKLVKQMQTNPNMAILSANQRESLESLLVAQPPPEELISETLLPNAIQYQDMGRSQKPRFVPIVSKTEQSWVVLNKNNNEANTSFEHRWNDLKAQILTQSLQNASSLPFAADMCLSWLFYVLYTQDGPGLAKPCAITYDYVTAFSIDLDDNHVTIANNLESYLQNCPSRLLLLPFHYAVNKGKEIAVCNVLLVDRVRKTAERFATQSHPLDPTIDKMTAQAMTLIPEIADYQLLSPMQLTSDELLQAGETLASQQSTSLLGGDPKMAYSVLFWTLYMQLRILCPDQDSAIVVNTIADWLHNDSNVEDVTKSRLTQYFALIQSAVPNVFDQPIAFRQFQKQYSIPWFYNAQDASRFHRLVEATANLKRCDDQVWDDLIHMRFSKQKLETLLQDVIVPPTPLLTQNTRFAELYDKYIHSMRSIPMAILEKVRSTDTFKMVYVTEILGKYWNVGVLINANFQTYEIFDPLSELENPDGSTRVELVTQIIETCQNALPGYSLVQNNLESERLDYDAPGRGKLNSKDAIVNKIIRRCLMHLLYLRFVLVTSAIPSAIIAQLLNNESPMLLLRLLCHDLTI